MKKILLTIAVAAASLSASAQVYLGGEVGAWRNSDDNHTSFTIHPELGYKLSDKWDLGIGFGYNYNYYGSTPNKKVHNVTIDPYARWSFVKFGPVKLFLDMGFGINPVKTKIEGLPSQDAEVAWRVGVMPGVSVALNKKIDFIAHTGFLGYREADGRNSAYGEQGFGFTLSGNDLLSVSYIISNHQYIALQCPIGPANIDTYTETHSTIGRASLFYRQAFFFLSTIQVRI